MCVQRFALLDLHCSDMIGREPRTLYWHYLINFFISALVPWLAVRPSLFNPFTQRTRRLCHLARPHSSNAYSVVFEYPEVAEQLDARARGSKVCGRDYGIVVSPRAAPVLQVPPLV